MPDAHDGLPPVCDYEGSDYQQRFWEQANRAYEDRVEAIALRRLLAHERGELLLEVGAGAGRNTPRYEAYRRIVLLDYSRTMLRQAQERLGHSERYIYVAANAYALPFVEGLFDGATMIRVLHHMADPLRVLREVRRVLRPQAAFILEFANKRNLKAILRWLARRQTWNPFSLEPVEFAPLNFDFHPAQVDLWLREAHFHVERRLTVSHFRLEVLKRIFPLDLLIALDAVAQLTGDWWQLTPSVLLRARAVGETPQAEPDTFFACPRCGTSLPPPQDNRISCACGVTWGVRDGIYDFKEPLESASA